MLQASGSLIKKFWLSSSVPHLMLAKSCSKDCQLCASNACISCCSWLVTRSTCTADTCFLPLHLSHYLVLQTNLSGLSCKLMSAGHVLRGQLSRDHMLKSLLMFWIVACFFFFSAESSRLDSAIQKKFLRIGPTFLEFGNILSLVFKTRLYMCWVLIFDLKRLNVESSKILSRVEEQCQCAQQTPQHITLHFKLGNHLCLDLFRFWGKMWALSTWSPCLTYNVIKIV